MNLFNSYSSNLQRIAALKILNFLSYQIFNFYKKQVIKVVDIGSNTENSIPNYNYGLCEFKESIGCSVLNKSSFSKQIGTVNKNG